MVFRYHHAKISKSMSLLSVIMCSLLCTALHPHTHSSPLRGSSPAPYGAKTAYVGGVPVSQARYGVTGKLIMPAYKSLPVTPYQLCIVTSFQHSTDFLRSPSKWKTACNGFRDFLSRCMSKTKCRGQLFETHNPKRSMKFQSSFDHGIFIRTLWMHLLRKSRKLVRCLH